MYFAFRSFFLAFTKAMFLHISLHTAELAAIFLFVKNSALRAQHMEDAKANTGLNYAFFAASFLAKYSKSFMKRNLTHSREHN